MTPDLIERATKAIDLFDAICNIHDPSVSAHDRRVRAMVKVLEAAPSPSPAPGVVEQNAETHLSNLLARIHRDGGHYEAEHGTDKACEDADRIIAELYAATPANPAQVTDAMVEHMVQQFLRWKLPDDFNPDGGIQFVKQTDYGHKFEPVGTNLFDYKQAKALVLHMLEGLSAIGAGGQAVASLDDVAARLWKADAEDSGTPASVANGRTREAFDDQAEELKARWRKFAKAASSALSQPHPADERVVEALREISNLPCNRENSSDYNRGWNDARFRARQIAEAALADGGRDAD